MVFSSILFLCVFLPVVIGVNFLLPARLRNFWLLLGSLLFYAWGEPRYILLMAATALVDFLAGLLLGRAEKPALRKAILAVTVVLNLGSLCFFKYTDFLIGNLNSLFGGSLRLLGLALPVGISFYTFQTLSYVIDVYRREVGVQRNFVDFFMYVTLFPQLIAGPIVRYSDVEKELHRRVVTVDGFAHGAIRFCVGLGKKVLLANQAGALYENARALSLGGEGSVLCGWLLAVAFTFQIYFDFSGYSDMAIGMGEMLGFHFPENFRYPYEADSITDFWRRWHITLSTWFREYLYIPLGGNRKGRGRQIFNLFVVWALTGIWHGAGWNFLLWGLYFFLLLTLEKLFLLRLLEKIPAFFRHFLALLAIVFGWVLFSSESIGEVAAIASSMVGIGAPLLTDGALYLLRGGAALLLLCAVGSTRFPSALLGKIEGKWGEKAAFPLRGVGALALLLLSVCFLAGDSYNPFLYFRF